MKILNPVIFVAPDFLGTNLTNQSRSMTLKTRQRRTKQTAPKVQLIASAKNSVKNKTAGILFKAGLCIIVISLILKIYTRKRKDKKTK